MTSDAALMNVEAIAASIATYVANEVMCPEHGYSGPSVPINARITELLRTWLAGGAAESCVTVLGRGPES